MDIFAYPSVEKDTSPLALLSALACGLPIVAFDIEGVQEVLGTSGMTVPVRDENKLAAALEVLICDSALREKMKNASREKALEKFSLKQYVRSMEEIFLQEF
jgi:glycosyltransferase involved in cell wall biosynthesis